MRSEAQIAHVSEYNREYRRKNLELLKTKERIRRALQKQDPAWVALNRQRAREWYRKNKKRAHAMSAAWAKAHPEQVRAWHAKQREEHPERRASYAHKRRSREGSPMDPVLVADLLLHERCYYCTTALTHGRRKKGEPYDPQRVTIDHLTPLSRGGTNTNENLVAACARCNFSKNAKTAEEYFVILARRVQQPRT